MSESPLPKPAPLVKWAGGKRQLQNIIASAFDSSGWDRETGKYFEPFFGGGAMFFHIQPKRAAFSDLNSSLISLYKEVKSHPDRLMDLADGLKSTFENFGNDLEAQRKFFDERKARFNDIKGKPSSTDDSHGPFLPDPTNEAEIAALFLFLNKAGFNGMYRENSKGEYNIPFGQRSTISLFNENNVKSVSEALREVEPQCVDYLQLIEPTQVKRGDLVYLDPPYVPLTKTSSFASYTKSGFGETQQLQLLERAKTLAEAGAHVFISNSSAEWVKSAYTEAGFVCHGVDANRAIGAKSASRKPVKEVLAYTQRIDGLEVLEPDD